MLPSVSTSNSLQKEMLAFYILTSLSSSSVSQFSKISPVCQYFSNSAIQFCQFSSQIVDHPRNLTLTLQLINTFLISTLLHLITCPCQYYTSILVYTLKSSVFLQLPSNLTIILITQSYSPNSTSQAASLKFHSSKNSTILTIQIFSP